MQAAQTEQNKRKLMWLLFGVQLIILLIMALVSVIGSPVQADGSAGPVPAVEVNSDPPLPAGKP